MRSALCPPGPVHIGVDATCWQNGRGYGRHLRSLLSALLTVDTEHHYALFVDSPERLDGILPPAEVRVVPTARSAARAASADGHRSISDLLRMSRAMSDPRLALLLFPTIYTYVPVWSRAKKLVMIHDVIPECYPALTLPTVTARFLWRAKVALGRRQADAIITVSEYSRENIARRLAIPAERMFVVGEASDPVFRVLDRRLPSLRLASLGIDGIQRIVVYVGGFGPHKNVESLARAFAAVRVRYPDIQLVLVGEYEREVFYSRARDVQRLVGELGAADRVVFTGYLPDDDLVALLNLATVLVLPSLMEGFGLPAIEAAACGCPVIATAASPLPALLGEGALYVDPTRPADLEAALERVLGDVALQHRMREAGLAAARRLSWQAAARDLLDVFRRVLTP